jgi:hypothetical protein
MRTSFLFMEFFFMIFLEVDVVHLMADRTFFDVSSAVAKVSAYFAFREELTAVVASLLLFVVHLELLQNQKL